jgi:hypothetical protein
MARSKIIECVHCQGRIGLVEGIGVFSYPKGSRRSMVLRESEPFDREAIEAIEAQHAINWHKVGITRGIRECPQCHSIRSYFITEFNYDERQNYHSACPCPECGTAGIEWTTPCEELYCITCGKNGFEVIAFKILD